MLLNKESLKSSEGNYIRDESLDFKGIPASEGVNAIHSYPAMFHPRLIGQLISSYSKIGECILDPFMGSGVAAVETSVSGRKFYGFDINPLAILIARVRLTPIKTNILEKELSNILKIYKTAAAKKPDFMNINFWFSKERIESISKIITAIEHIKDKDIRRFFEIALSETIRLVSWSKPNEFKLVRRRNPCLISTISVFETKAEKNIKILTSYYSNHEIHYSPKIQRNNILTEKIPLKNNSISLLITSPPYGDSQTTVAYGQFSRLSLQWLGLPYNNDKESLGAKAVVINGEIPSQYLYKILNKIKKIDTKRSMQVYSFYYELFKCMEKLIPKVRNGGHLIFVVGNRTVKGMQLPTDVICAEMLESFGCSHIETRVRQISNKRMPSQNSPTNIPGKKAPTMKYEYIVIYRKK